MVAVLETAVERFRYLFESTCEYTAKFYEWHRPGVIVIDPRVVVSVLKKAHVSFVLMGTHGTASYRGGTRSTEDVDVLVAKRDHRKAVVAIQKKFPELIVEDGVVVTRFREPMLNEPRIDLMKPQQEVFRMVFRQTVDAGGVRIPNLEMAIVSKFAAMVSPYRKVIKKHIDISDFMLIVQNNAKVIDRGKLRRLAKKVYPAGDVEIERLVQDVLAGRDITV